MVGLIIFVSCLALLGVGVGYIEIIVRILRKCGCGKIPEVIMGCFKRKKPEAEEERKIAKVPAKHACSEACMSMY